MESRRLRNFYVLVVTSVNLYQEFTREEVLAAVDAASRVRPARDEEEAAGGRLEVLPRLLPPTSYDHTRHLRDDPTYIYI